MGNFWHLISGKSPLSDQYSPSLNALKLHSAERQLLAFNPSHIADEVFSSCGHLCHFSGRGSHRRVLQNGLFYKHLYATSASFGPLPHIFCTGTMINWILSCLIHLLRSLSFALDASACAGAGAPLKVADKDDWCPVNFCAPSWISAPDCPISHESATHKCSIQSRTYDTWTCDPTANKKRIGTPLGCAGSECKDEIVACKCSKSTVSRDILIPTLPIQPICYQA